jgi:hypothetical protein
VSAPPAAPAAGLPESYFDRLDEAFANLSGTDYQPAAPPSAPLPLPVPAAAKEADWFSTRPPQPATPPAAPARVESQQTDSVSQPAVPSPPASLKQAAPKPMPELADAFAALLEAERQSPPAAAPSWPAQAAAPAPPAPDPQELVEEVTRRVVEQMTDRVVRETVSEIVSEVAERLIRAEIDRIKNSLKQ